MKSKATPKAAHPRTPHHRPAQHHEVVDPRWIAKALVLTLLIAGICGYLTLCLYFYQGQWQLVLHPSSTISATPASSGISFEEVHFAVDDSGQPQLDGWFLPRTPTDARPQATILYLHTGDGSLSDTLPQLQSLHALGYSIFAFDYRGFGKSAAVHPNQQRMSDDAEHALTYLTTTRKTPLNEIIPYGIGVGASLAAALTRQHPQLPALILESPKSDLIPIVAQDARARFIPLHLFFHNDFPLAATLHTLATPKLLLSYGAESPPIFRNAADPKTTVEFLTPSAADYTSALTRFSAQYLPPSGVPELIPTAK